MPLARHAACTSPDNHLRCSATLNGSSRCISKNARNPEGARVFLSWLASEEGALAYEQATGRGNPIIAKTKTAQFIKGKKLSEWPPEKSDQLGALNDYYNKMLETVGAAR